MTITKKVLSFAMAAIMSIAMLGTTTNMAFAEPHSGNSVHFDEVNQEVTFDSKINVGEAITAPAVSIGYTVTSGGEAGTQVKAGPLEAITTESPSAVFATDDDITGSGTKRLATQGVTIGFDSSVFTETGIYHYTVTQTQPDKLGMVYDSVATRQIYCFVIKGEDGFKVKQVVMYAGVPADPTVGDTKEAKKSEGFLNGYGVKTSGDPLLPSDPNAPQDVTIKSWVAGDMADHTKEFVYTASAGLEMDTGAQYATVVKAGDDEAPGTTMTWDGSNFTTGETVELHDGQSLIIKNVFPTQGLTMTGTAADNYKLTSKNSVSATLEDIDVDETAVSVLVATGAADTNGAQFKHTYTSVIPATGVLLEFAPYVLSMLLLASGICFFAFASRKKKHNENL